ncbi:MAG: peptide-methionine (S)-S-oxide reductase MsrA [Candidatus Nanopelagicales bacterium]
MKTLYLGMGCFWGAEKKLWQIPGVVETEVGYQGGDYGPADYPTVCTGRTGHAEVVRVQYDETVVPTREILRVFWENHDPTQGDRQGNDIGSQYRSLVYWTDEGQQEEVEQTLDQFAQVLAAGGLGPITTETDNAAAHPFFPAEEYHQKYLQKNPKGYDCHAHTGFHLPK